MNEISTKYNPKETEDKWYKLWEEKGYFHAAANSKKKPYSIVIPPPNVTGILHMGHALNNTIQDIYTRFNKMRGCESLWMPGTDHAGIATQNVVEKKLLKQNTKRDDLGREKFLEEVWKWREEYGSTIINQLKKLGCACDWDRTRFTMDEVFSDAVLEVFVRLHKKGLIYRGNYIINWCPRCQTALSDEEAEHRDVDGMLYHIRYPIRGQKSEVRGQKSEVRGQKSEEYVVIATTRPETMLGDVAICVNPKDKRYKHLKGKTAVLPILERELKIIFDSKVDMSFGTGVLKVTPAHDPVDFELGITHKLDPINVMNDDATMNKDAGENYIGMDRFECREAVIEDLKGRKLFVKSEAHRHAVGHCYRCHTMVEPRLSKQWFVKMKPLSKKAIEVVKKGKIKFYPQRWTKVYLNWMENIRDWCISRQIWWGHRIPVYYCNKCQEVQKSEIRGQKGVIVSKIKPEKCPDCGSTDFTQDEDVLDTWFSSWLWPFATFGWPFSQKSEVRGQKSEADLKYFYPTNVLVTAQEIIFFWVARMIMSGLEFMNDIPFRDVYIHGTVRDVSGKKMSKSLGNSIDPLDIIEKYGTDALRFSIISLTATGQDVYLSNEKFETGRNFANKIWNASRFVLMNLKEGFANKSLCQTAGDSSLTLADRWILSRFYRALADVEKSLDVYRINDAANRIYEFLWGDFCDWYLELAKLTMGEPHTRLTLYKILEKSLRVLHPFMPFITEEVWQRLPREHDTESIMVTSWPHMQKDFVSNDAENRMAVIIDVIKNIRNIRAVWRIEHKHPIKVVIKTKNEKDTKLIEEGFDYIKQLAKTEKIEVGVKCAKPAQSASSVMGNVEIFVPLGGVIDVEKEKARLGKKLEELNAHLGGVEKKLANKGFLAGAPKDVVEKTKEKKEAFKVEISSLKKNLDTL